LEKVKKGITQNQDELLEKSEPPSMEILQEIAKMITTFLV